MIIKNKFIIQPMGNKSTKPAYTIQDLDTFLNYKYTQISALYENGCIDIALNKVQEISKFCAEYTDDVMKLLYPYKFLYCYVPDEIIYKNTCKTDFNISIYNSLGNSDKDKYVKHFTNIAMKSFDIIGHSITRSGLTQMFFINKHYIVQGSSEGSTLGTFPEDVSSQILRNLKYNDGLVGAPRESINSVKPLDATEGSSEDAE